jgi:dihydropyrimidinase
MDLDPGGHDIEEGEVDMTDELIGSIIEEGSKVRSIILVHAEDPVQCSEEIRIGRDKGLTGLKAWSTCRPRSSEARSIVKASKIGRMFGANLYFAHIGSTTALDSILAEREKGNSNYYIETCPHYLTHTSDFDDVVGKVVPPIRSKSDQQSMWSALRNGIVDTIGTDHVANKLAQKMGKGDIWSALAGFPGVATMLPVLLSEGVNKDRISIERVTEVTSYNAARIFGMYPKKGTLQQGSDADLVMVDLDLEKTVTPELLQSYSDYTIYDGWELKGWPVMTIVRGRVVMEDGLVDSDAVRHGEFVPRPSAL